MMNSSGTRLLFSQFSPVAYRYANGTKTIQRRLLSQASRLNIKTTSSSMACTMSAVAVLTATTLTTAAALTNMKTCVADSRIAATGDIIQTGVPVKEKATGILFPKLCNGLFLTGCGVRIKYGFIKVYAVGTYMDPLAMSAVKTADQATIEQALLNPTYPRTIRIVMNRSLSMDKYTQAIVDALLPRMKGQDLEKLEDFKKLNPAGDLVEGAEMEMMIRGDTLLYKNAMGQVGTIRSEIFTAAMCDVFYGSDAVSPTHKEEVLNGIPKL